MVVHRVVAEWVTEHVVEESVLNAAIVPTAIEAFRWPGRNQSSLKIARCRPQCVGRRQSRCWLEFDVDVASKFVALDRRWAARLHLLATPRIAIASANTYTSVYYSPDARFVGRTAELFRAE